MSLPALSLLETRVLGVLIEKQHTVPDTYPLSLNALVQGCNQKTARDPVLDVPDADVLEAIDTLKSLSLVIEVSGSRVVRYEHNLGRVLGVPSQSVALLALLMLRGPQTPAELRAHTERLHRFADTSSVEAFLDELAGHQPPYVARLARQPGAREARWAHALSGAVIGGPLDLVQPGGAGSDEGPAGEGSQLLLARSEVATLRAELQRQSAELLRLRAQVQHLAAALGVDLDAP